MNENNDKITYSGEIFQQNSKNVRDQERSIDISERKQTDLYKKYQNAITKIDLPEPQFSDQIKFWDIIKNRKTRRTFGREPLSIMELSLLLFGMSGLSRKFPKFAFRTVPSAGGLFPIEIYPVVNNVSDIKKGIYHYDIQNHALEYLKEGDFRKSLSNACYGQRIISKSAVNFIWTAMIERSRNAYSERAYRFIYLDCGHIGQNFYLVAEALGLSACVVGAYYDDDINQFLELEESKEFAIYIGVVGKKK